jgi:H+/Cl- antiporter ClcA
MKAKIIGCIREYIVGLSIITIIIGLVVLFMGVMWLWFNEATLGFYTDIINQLEGWNMYLLVIGFILLAIGVWYLYTYHKNRKFILEEFETNKRSEFLKVHTELKAVVKYMPSKYKRLLQEKEKELKIK